MAKGPTSTPMSRESMKIHESARADGVLSPVHLRVACGALSIATEEDGELPVIDGALEAVMRRFGGPLEASEAVVEVAALELGEGRSLRHVRHRARYDVVARDFLVYVRPGQDALCALAVTVAGALMHLARAAPSSE